MKKFEPTKVPHIRIINGKVYTLHSMDTEKSAKLRAVALRKEGFLVRVVKKTSQKGVKFPYAIYAVYGGKK